MGNLLSLKQFLGSYYESSFVFSNIFDVLFGPFLEGKGETFWTFHVSKAVQVLQTSRSVFFLLARHLCVHDLQVLCSCFRFFFPSSFLLIFQSVNLQVDFI